MSKEIRVDRPLLQKQLRLIDKLAAGYHEMKEEHGKLAWLYLNASRKTAKARMDQLDGLAQFLSELNAQLKEDPDGVVVYPAPEGK